MCEEGAAKLRLKPRTALPARGRERSPGPQPPPRPQTSTDRSSWFEKEELNECEKIWILLLKDISQDSQHCTNWDTVPSFPEFLEKKQQEKSPEHQEVFTVGTKDFHWVSFPSFHKEKCPSPKDLSSQQPTQSRSNQLHKGQGQADKPKSLSTAEKTCGAASPDQARTASGADTKGVSELGVSPKPCELPGHSSSAQSPAGALSPRQHRPGTAHNSWAGGTGKGEGEPQIQTHPGDAPLGEATGAPAENPRLGSAPGAESHEEMENQSEAASALDSCPMCLMQFGGRLSQLDIDGHLARCLSESADDVMW